jgi:hypothetical protein
MQLKRTALGVAVAALLILAGPTSASWAAPSSPSAGRAEAAGAQPGAGAESDGVSVAANTCRLPQGAGSGSRFVSSFSSCGTCMSTASSRTLSTGAATVFYCTYNTGNGLTDLHSGTNLTTCNLPTSAGPGSVFAGSYSACRTCAIDAANLTLSPSNPSLWYCTYNPGNRRTDLHR